MGAEVAGPHTSSNAFAAPETLFAAQGSIPFVRIAADDANTILVCFGSMVEARFGPATCILRLDSEGSWRSPKQLPLCGASIDVSFMGSTWCITGAIYDESGRCNRVVNYRTTNVTDWYIHAPVTPQSMDGVQ